MMSKQKVPELRFPEFDSEWEKYSINDFLTESKVIGNKGDNAKKLTVKLWGKGIVPKYDVYRGSDKTQYYIRKKGQLMYGKLDFLNCAFGIVPEYLDGYESTIDSPAFDFVKGDSTFIIERVKQKSFYKKYGEKANGSRKAKRINQKDFLEMPIYAPEEQEQKKIGNFFSKLDRLIELEEKKLELLEEQKKGYMQKIFSQELRFKDENGNDYPEWEKRRVQDVYQVTRGYVLSRNDVKSYVDGEYKYPVYSSQTASGGLMGYYNDFLYENAITWTTDGANAGAVNFRSGKFYCTNVCGVLLNEKYANKCMAAVLNNITYKHVSYVGNPKLMNNTMGNIKIMVPNLKEQEKISSLLESLDKRSNKLEDKLKNLNMLKRGLLHKMFI